MINIKIKNKILIALLFVLTISLALFYGANSIKVNASYTTNYSFISAFKANNGRITKNDTYITYQINGENSFAYIGTKDNQISEQIGGEYSANLLYRNTIFMHLKNNTSASKLKIQFITSISLTYNDEKSIVFDILPNSEYTSYYFNLSLNENSRGYLRGFRIIPLEVTSGSIDIAGVFFEKEDACKNYAGNIASCLSDGNVVTVTGSVLDEYKNKTIKLYQTSLANVSESVSGLTAIATTKANENNFTIKFPHYNREVSNISSQFIAVVDGISISKMFKIDNYADFTENPYNFTLNNLSVNASDYGAKGDGFTDDTKSIQNAIDYVASQGGGKVILQGGKNLLQSGKVISQGGKNLLQSGKVISQNSDVYKKRYKATCIKLKDNVNLHIESGAMLLQSRNALDYDYKVTLGHDTKGGAWDNIAWSHAALCSNYPLIYAYDVDNIKITGNGIIKMSDTGIEDNNYESTNNLAIGCTNKIHIIPIGMYKCNNVEITDISIIRASAYNIAGYDISNAYIGNVIMKDSADIGSDGISLGAGSKNIKIDSCQMYVTDDAVVLWSTSAGEVRDFWWNNVPNKDNKVMNIDITHSYITGGHGVTFVTWGTDASDLSKQEISDVNITDNILANGNTAIAGWYDNPYYGVSQGGSAGGLAEFDFSSIKNLTILNNTIYGIANLAPVPVTNFINDCGMCNDFNSMFMSGATGNNANFEDINGRVSGLAYWSAEYNSDNNSVGVTANENGKCGYIGDFSKGNARLYQGLYKTVGKYTFQADVKISDNASGARMFVQNAITKEIVAEKKFVNTNFTRVSLDFNIEREGIYYFGIDGGDSVCGYAYIDNPTAGGLQNKKDQLFTENFETEKINNNIVSSGFEIENINNNKMYVSSNENAISKLNFLNNQYSNFALKTNVTLLKSTNTIVGGFLINFNQTELQFNFNRYCLYYNLINKQLILSKFDMGDETILAIKYNCDLALNETYEIAIKTDLKGEISVYINEKQAIKYIDKNPLIKGKISMSTYYSKCAFDDISIGLISDINYSDSVYEKYFTENFETENINFDNYNYYKVLEDKNNAIKSGELSDINNLNFNSVYQNVDLKTDIFIKDKNLLSQISFNFYANANFYYNIKIDNNEVSINKISSKVEELAKCNFNIKPNEWYTFGVRISGKEISLFINGANVLSVNNSENKSGYLQISATNISILLDDITIGEENTVNFDKTRVDIPEGGGDKDDGNKDDGEVIKPPKKSCKKNSKKTEILLVGLMALSYVVIKKK